jgi:DHA2 family multidrug resistance protein
MMRNLGGAVGIAASGAILNNRTNFHFLNIASHMTAASGATMQFVSATAARYAAADGSAPTAHAAALKALWQLAYREASTMAYADAFRVIMIAFVVATALVPLMRNVAPAGPAPSGH